MAGSGSRNSACLIRI